MDRREFLQRGVQAGAAALILPAVAKVGAIALASASPLARLDATAQA